MALWILGGLLATGLLAAVAAAALGSSRFRSRYEAEKAQLLQSASLPAAASGAAEDLPPPVRRYLEVLEATQAPPLRAAILAQRGTLRTATDKPWMPFTAEQVYGFEPPGFVWIAEAKVAPMVHMLARDKFVGGKGNMWITLLGAITVADSSGPGMDVGAGLRYWGEVVAFPEAVRSPYLRWEAVDAQSARLFVTQGDLETSALIEFDEDGLVAAMHGQRPRDVGGASVLTPWSGHMRDWKRIDGRRFPGTWESVWHLDEGDLTAVRMEILSVETRP